MKAFEDVMKQGGSPAISAAGDFFIRTDPVHRTLREVAARLDQNGVAYAVAGGMALVAHGYDRTTIDVDVLLTKEGHAAAYRALDGLGFLPLFANSKNLLHTETGVRVKFLITGGFPGDRKPKAVAFPDPATVSVEKDGIRYVNLPTLIELKLASGMTAPHRLKDLADVQELIKTLKLPSQLSQQLDPSVRTEYLELWESSQGHPAEE